MSEKSKNSYKDEYPQFLNAKVVETAANTFSVTSINLPVVQTLNNGKALVVEILKIVWMSNLPEMINIQTTEVNMFLLKKNIAPLGDFSATHIIDFNVLTRTIFDTAATDGTLGWTEKLPVIHDLSDSNGKGYLVGNQQIFLAIVGTNNANVKNGWVKILYRLKQVSATELIGMIQE